MALKNQVITKDYALYHGDCIEIMKDLPDNKIDLSIYSPPFTGLYHYSSSERDLSNADDYEDFFTHYEFVVKGIHRLTKQGRCTAVHCMDVPTGNSGKDGLTDFPGDIIRLHQKIGFDYICRHAIWKEPLTVRNRTMQKNLAHKTIVDDSIYGGVAGADYLLIFRKKGENRIPVQHPTGFDFYAGDIDMPYDIHKYMNYNGDQKENKFSHWIWRNYASSFWFDIRLDNVLQFKESRDEEDEKHVHPLQLDVINRVIIMRTNPNEIVFTPFMGVGSEVFGAVLNHRKGIGVELKESYFKQSIKNLANVYEYRNNNKQNVLFDMEN
jgi:DNA modification methylase